MSGVKDLAIFRKIRWPGLAGAVALSVAVVDPIFGPLIYAQVFLHEMGHAVALTRVWKRPIEKVTFSPLGGAVHFDQTDLSESMNTQVSLAGPATGILGGLFLAGASFAVAPGHLSYLLMESASFGFFFNATNLTPLLPLDGGRVFALYPSYYKLPPLCLASALFFTDTGIMSPLFFYLYAGGTVTSIVRANWTSFEMYDQWQTFRLTRERRRHLYLYGALLSALTAGWLWCDKRAKKMDDHMHPIIKSLRVGNWSLTF